MPPSKIDHMMETAQVEIAVKVLPNDGLILKDEHYSNYGYRDATVVQSEFDPSDLTHH